MTDPALPFTLEQVALGNHAFEGNNNAYLLTGDGPTTLLDTGVVQSEGELESGLAEFGVSFADIDQVILTHWHGDHAGLAGTIQAASGAPVYAHTLDAPIVCGDPDAQAAMDARIEERLLAWGMPDAEREELLDFLDGAGGEGRYAEVTEFEAGATFEAGDAELEAVHLPGHTMGLTGFEVAGRDGTELFSGDALLPYYTPNVGGADTRVDDPLADYLDTLETIVAGDYTRAWPGHRGAIIDPAGRAKDIAVHHRERTDRVLSVLEDGPATAWEVSAALFGDLHSIHVLHGPGEAFAHLHHLETGGKVERDGTRYALVDDSDVDALFPAIALGN
ncbi:MBL fold metallo-hydrolase [Natronomonas sp. EA1]|uniref:MBL fold metallo-hydrolase n=1 Tax=Natronomonas sp. EA1 TaxID=3421655 RepID=UPI003EBE7AF2